MTGYEYFGRCFLCALQLSTVQLRCARGESVLPGSVPGYPLLCCCVAVAVAWGAVSGGATDVAAES
jgi:hypothetical protein